MKAFLFLVFFIFPIAAYGQITPITGALTGHVYDDFGSLIPEAIIKIRGADQLERNFRTNAEGAFQIDLKGGNYFIEVRALGFQPFRLERFRVISHGVQNFDIVLDAGPGDHSIQISINRKKKRN